MKDSINVLGLIRSEKTPYAESFQDLKIQIPQLKEEFSFFVEDASLIDRITVLQTPPKYGKYRGLSQSIDAIDLLFKKSLIYSLNTGGRYKDSEIKLLCDFSSDLIQNLSSSHDIVAFMEHLVNSFPKNQWKEIVDLFVPVSKKVQSNVHLILSTFVHFSKPYAQECLEGCYPLFYEVKDGAVACQFLYRLLACLKTPIEYQTHINLLDFFIFKRQFSVEQILSLYLETSRIPSERIDFYIDIADAIIPSLSCIEEKIHSLHLLSRYFRRGYDLSTLEKIILTFAGTEQYSTIKEVIEVASKLSPGRAHALLTEVDPILSLFLEVDKKALVFLLISQIPQPEVSQAISEMLYIANHLISPSEYFELVLVLRHFPAESITATLEIIKSYRLLDSWEPFEQVDVLAAIMDSMSPKDPQYLSIMQSICDTYAFASIKNPFVIYGKLIALQNKSFLIDPPSSEIISEQWGLNFSPFMLRKENFIFKESVLRLLKGRPLCSQLLLGNVNRMTCRINALDSQEQQAIYAKARDICGSLVEGIDQMGNKDFFASLLSNLQDPFFISLLDTPLDNEVSFIQAYFIALVCNIDDLSLEPKKGLLSPHEEVMLMTSSSIAQCKVGKTAGISSAYRLLPKDKQFNTTQFEFFSQEQQRCYLFVYSAFQEAVEHMLSTASPFMRAVLAEHEIHQLSHQSLYVKNALCQFIGLDHNLVFDRHTEVLYSKLVESSIEELLLAFFEYFDAAFFVQLVQKAFERNTVDKNLYMSISEFLGDTLDITGIWRICAENGKPSLSCQGALRLLEKLQLIYPAKGKTGFLKK